jgi:flagella basal body P-ring formation protein FlgA
MTRLLLAVLLCAVCRAGDRVAELSSARVSAADVFPGAGSDADLGPAPAPGVQRRVLRTQLLRWARQAGLEIAPAELTEALTLVRQVRRLEEHEAAELAASLLAKTTGASSVDVEPLDYAAPEIPAGALAWSLVGSPSGLDRPVRIHLRWRDDGGRSGVEGFTARIAARAQSLTAVHDLPAGVALQPADFTLNETALNDTDSVYLTQLPSDTVLVLERELKAGESLTEDILDRRPEVERGAMVELVAAVGAVRLRAPGRAEGQGSTGDLVPFRNLATDQRVVARVTGPQTAEVVAP